MTNTYKLDIILNNEMEWITMKRIKFVYDAGYVGTEKSEVF